MEWIKCSDRMPEHYVPVLIVYIECDGTLMVYSGMLDSEDEDDLFWHMWGYANHENKIIELNKITHWMPLPELPK